MLLDSWRQSHLSYIYRKLVRALRRLYSDQKKNIYANMCLSSEEWEDVSVVSLNIVIMNIYIFSEECCGEQCFLYILVALISQHEKI